jgi:hypothetical protein
MATTTIQGNGGTNVYLKQNGSDVQYSDDQVNWDTIVFPCDVENTNTSLGMLTIIFTTDITLYTNDSYFRCISSHIQFGKSTLNDDGTRPTITIDSVTGYIGLILNTIAHSYITIINLHVDGSNSTLGSGSGWVAGQNFGQGVTNNIIKNCSSEGPITSGGIVGSFSGSNGGNVQIIGCSSNGDIINTCGGIVGVYCAQNGGTVIIDRCYSKGIIGTGSTTNGAGGIVGNYCGDNGTVRITNCFSTGPINANGAGGITGLFTGSNNATVTIEKCYSIGNIPPGGGGITGAETSSLVTVTNCFSTGPINGGGIVGQNSPNVSVTYCYTSGMKGGTRGGIFEGSLLDNRAGSSNNFSEANSGGNTGIWNRANAIQYLLDVPSATQHGTVWSEPVIGNSFILSNSGYTPYSINLVDAAASTIQQGGATAPPIVPGYTTFVILEINGETRLPNFSYIDVDSNGEITADATTPVGTYTIFVYSSKNPYSVTEYELTLEEAPAPPGPSADVTLSCCDRPIYCKGYDNNTITQLKSGNVLIGSVTKKPYTSYAEYCYKKMAAASKR